MLKLFLFALSFALIAAPAQAGPLVAAWQMVSTMVATFASTTLGSIVVDMIAGTALSVLGSLYTKSQMEQGQPGISTDSTTTGETVPFSFIVGQTATEGHLLAPMMTYTTGEDPNEWLVYVIGISDLPTTNIPRIWIDGKAYTFNEDPSAPAIINSVRLGSTVGVDGDDAHDRIFFRYHKGNQTTADQYLRYVFGAYPNRPWLADMVLRSCSYVVVTVKGRAQDEAWQGYPTVRFEVQGMPVFDPRDATQNINNPATWKYNDNLMVLAFNVLRGLNLPTGDTWGVGAEEFFSSQIIAAMNVAGETVATQSGNRPRYRGGMEIAVDQEPFTILNELVKGCGGMYADMGGTWTLRCGPMDAPSLSITDQSILISQSTSFTPFPSVAQSINAVYAQYPDRASNYSVRDAVPYLNAAWELEDGGRRLPASVNFPVVWDGSQVRALMREMAKDARRMRVHSIALPRAAAGYKIGDIMRWSSVINRYSNKSFEIVEKSLDPLTLASEYIIRECDPSDYDPDAGSDGVLPSVPNPLPVVPPIEGVFGWNAYAVVINSDTGRRVGIRLVWDPSINAQGIGYTIRHVASGDIVAQGTQINIKAGGATIVGGILPSTQYSVIGRRILNRRTTDTAAILVTTADIRIGREDLDEDILQDLEDALDWIGLGEGAIDELRDQINEDLELINSRIGDVEQDLTDTAAAIRQELEAGLDSASGWVETGIDDYDLIIQGQFQAMAGRIDQLTAALTSDNLISNGLFVADTAGWTLTNSPRTVKAAGSAAIILAAPEDTMVLIGQGSAGKIVTDLNEFAITADDRLQFRFSAASGATGRTLQFSFQPQTAAGVNIGSPIVTTVSITPANSWKVYSFQIDPPDNAVGGVLTITKPQTGSGVYITRIESTTVNIAIEARLTELEAAWVDPDGAFLTLQRNFNTRMGDAETDINEEIVARAQADGALGTRITNLATTVNGQGTRITTAETAIATANEAIAQSRQEIEASFGSLQMVKNPNFSQDLASWVANSGITGNWTAAERIAVRNKANAGSALIRTIPNQKAYRVYAADPTTARATSVRFDVQPGEPYTLAHWTFITPTTPRPNVLVRYFRQDGSVYAGINLAASEGNNGKWTYNVRADVVIPDDVVEADIQVMNARVDMTGWAAITGITFTRQEAFDSWSKSQIEINASSYAGLDAAFSLYQVQLNSRLGGIDDKVQANADALSTMYTRAQTNQAISAALIETNAKLNEASATGKFRVTSLANPAGAVARVGLAARAEFGQEADTAAMFIEALTGGGGRISFLADRFSIVNNATINSARTVPFYISDGVVYIKAAMIEDATISRLKIGPNQLYIPYMWDFDDIQIPAARNITNQMLIYDRIVTDFEGGGYQVIYQGYFDGTTSVDAFGMARLVLDGKEVRRTRFGVRGAGGSAVQSMFHVALSGNASGLGSTRVQLYAWAATYNSVSVGNAPYWLRSNNISLSGSRR